MTIPPFCMGGCLSLFETLVLDPFMQRLECCEQRMCEVEIIFCNIRTELRHSGGKVWPSAAPLLFFGEVEQLNERFIFPPPKLWLDLQWFWTKADSTSHIGLPLSFEFNLQLNFAHLDYGHLDWKDFWTTGTFGLLGRIDYEDVRTVGTFGLWTSGRQRRLDCTLPQSECRQSKHS